jgi:hypothetical protein
MLLPAARGLLGRQAGSGADHARSQQRARRVSRPRAAST